MDLEHCYELLADISDGQDVGPIEPLCYEETAAVLDVARVVASGRPSGRDRPGDVHPPDHVRLAMCLTTERNATPLGIHT